LIDRTFHWWWEPRFFPDISTTGAAPSRGTRSCQQLRRTAATRSSP
jgi:hypothetical protein